MSSSISIDEKIDAILESIEHVKKPNFARLAREEDVPYDRLLARSKGRPTRKSRRSGTKKLSDAQEYALLVYIKRTDKLGICV